MSAYVDGFVFTIPKSKLAAYTKMAKKASRIWKEHGAVEYRECLGDDLKVKGMLPFTKLTKAKPSDVVIFSWVVFKSRRHRDAANKKIMADPRVQAMCSEGQEIIDGMKMSYGGFKTIVT